MAFLRRASIGASVVTFVLCFASCALAQSDEASRPPTATPADGGDKSQQVSDDKELQPRRDEQSSQARPTEDRDTSGPSTQDLRDAGKGKREDPSPSDIANGFIAVFTFALVAVAVLQYLAQRRQSAYMRDGLAETRKAADAAMRSAIVAEEALHVVHRAALHVEEIQMMRLTPTSFPNLVVQVTNVGQVQAEVTQVAFGVVRDEPMPPFPNRQIQWIDRGGLIAKGSHPATLTAGDVTDASVTEWAETQTGKRSLFVYGAIRYDAGFGYTGECGFGATYDASNVKLEPHRRFVTCEDTRYNYNSYTRKEDKKQAASRATLVAGSSSVRG